MKRIFSLVLALLFVCSLAFAESGFPSRGDLFLQSATIGNVSANNVGHTHISTGPSLVYRVVITSTEANTYCQLFDSNGTWGYDTTAAEISARAASLYTGTGGNKFIKADLGATTANTSYNFEFDPPIRFEQGILAGIAGDGGTDGVDTMTDAAVVSATIYYTSAE